MTNPGGRLGRTIVRPETILISHDERLKILERRNIAQTVASGSALLFGFGPPPGSIGQDGDFYLDIADDDNWIIYGPKLGTSWGIAFPLGPIPRRTVSFTTMVLAPGDTHNIDVEMFKQDRILHVIASAPAWIKGYVTPTHRIADATRDIHDDPERESDHGLLFEVSLGTGLLALNLSPVIYVYNEGVDKIIYFSVVNSGTETVAIDIDLITTRAE